MMKGDYVKVTGEPGLFMYLREQVSKVGAVSVIVQRVNKHGRREEFRAFRPERLRKKRTVRFLDHA